MPICNQCEHTMTKHLEDEIMSYGVICPHHLEKMNRLEWRYIRARIITIWKYQREILLVYIFAIAGIILTMIAVVILIHFIRKYW